MTDEQQAEAALSLMSDYCVDDIVKHSRGRLAIIREISPKGKLKVAWLCRSIGSERCQHSRRKDWWLYVCPLCDDLTGSLCAQTPSEPHVLRVDDWEHSWVFRQYVTLLRRA